VCLLCSAGRIFIDIYIDRRRFASSSDDDEFNPASEQDEDDGRSYHSSSSRRSAASASDTEGDFIVDDEDEDSSRKSKSKLTAKTGKKVKGNTTVADHLDADTTAFTLLTAAERREQGKKLEKKSTEEAFAFLQDVRDVRRFYIGLINH
jgi:DNA mismatch repair protein MSH6